ncbi:MAG: ATP-binding protein [Firmicutes bacterium]|nr:ATP-binding protein [Bacillota bacterium]
MESRTPFNILIIEDDNDQAILAQKALLLKNPSYNIMITHSGEAALQALDKNSFDMIFIDYSLPGITGLETLKKIKAGGFEYPLIIITGTGSEGAAVDAMKSGASDYVIKDENYANLLPFVAERSWNNFFLEKTNKELQKTIQLKVEELEETNKRLITMQRHMIQLEKMKALSVIVRGVTHELNNPLTGIFGYAQLLLESMPAADPRREDVAEIEACANRCKSIISRLSSFARQEKGPGRLINVSRLIEETVELMTYQIKKYGIEMQIENDENIPEIFADYGDLQQVFINLIINAIQAMPAGGKIRIITSAKGERGVEVTVKDAGHGIPEDLIDRIFNPFFTTREAGEGSGLGLSVCYRIVKELGGSITVESKVGSGTSFKIFLPVNVQ